MKPLAKLDSIKLVSLSTKLPSCSMAMIPIRYLILTLTFVTCCTIYITRYNLNVTIVSMVIETPNVTGTVQDYCPATFEPKPDIVTTNTTDSDDSSKRYDWPPTTQGIILGAFTATYVMGQIPSGRLAEVYGSKWILMVIITLSNEI